MKYLNTVVDALTKVIMAVSSFTVFVVTFLQVLSRYVLKAPFPWSQDVLRIAFAWMVFWGAAWCVKERGHLCVDALLSTFPKKLRTAVEIVINIVLCGFFVFLVIYGGKFAITGLTQMAPYLPIPMTLYYASIPSAAAVMLYYMVQVIFEDICSLFKKEEEKA